jgi:hypothetical protein
MSTLIRKHCPPAQGAACLNALVLWLGSTGRPASPDLSAPPFRPRLFVAAAHQNAVVVKSPKSGVNFFNLGDYEQQFEAARQRALPVLRQLLEEGRLAGSSGSGKNSGGSRRSSNNISPRSKLLQGNGGAATAASS